MSRLKIPHLNPLQFVEMALDEIPQYISRHMDDVLLRERLNQWQQVPNGYFLQPWQTSDSIPLQFFSSMGGVQLQLIDCNRIVAETINMTQIRQNEYEPGIFIYQGTFTLDNVPEGEYYVYGQVGTSPVKKYLISEPISVHERQENTLLIKYTNPLHKDDYVFATGIEPNIRIPAILRLKEIASKDTLYEDQVLDMVMVLSRSYRVWELIIIQVPDWLEDKLGYILGCRNLQIDGKYYTKNAETKLEQVEDIGNGVYKSFRIDLRASITRNSKEFDTDLDTDEELVVVLNTTSKGFGDSSNDIITIYDVE